MNASQKEPALFETSDLHLAAFLRCCNFTITGVRYQDKRTIFVFADSADLRKGIADFENDGAVPVRSFCNTVRDLQAIMR